MAPMYTFLYMYVHIYYIQVHMICIHKFISLAALSYALNREALSGPAAIGDLRGKSKHWMVHHWLLISAMTKAWHHYCHSKLRYFHGELPDMSWQERRWEDWNPRWLWLVELALNPSRILGEVPFSVKISICKIWILPRSHLFSMCLMEVGSKFQGFWFWIFFVAFDDESSSSSASPFYDFDK